MIPAQSRWLTAAFSGLCVMSTANHLRAAGSSEGHRREAEVPFVSMALCGNVRLVRAIASIL